jgi:hypothetical protein
MGFEKRDSVIFFIIALPNQAAIFGVTTDFWDGVFLTKILPTRIFPQVSTTGTRRDLAAKQS